MGNDLCKSNYNLSKSGSYSSSNSGKRKDRTKAMDDRPENKNTIIHRVWIVKKSISNDNVMVLPNNPYGKDIYLWLNHETKGYTNLLIPKKNIFNIKNEFKFFPKHWATILELSNETYVSIQFGQDGFSLKEFDKTNINGESVLLAILNTWGEEGDPFSFVYLGIANKKYSELIEYLKMKKFGKNGVVYYNLLFNNCQHVTCDIEKILYDHIYFWHSFDYYLNAFFENFFPDVDINILKRKYESDLVKNNEKLFIHNIRELNRNKSFLKKEIRKITLINPDVIINCAIQASEILYSLKFNDYINQLKNE